MAHIQVLSRYAHAIASTVAGKEIARVALWVVKGGRSGEKEELALQENVAIIGWDALPDLSHIRCTAEREVARDFLGTRLWTSDDVIRGIEEHYDRLPEVIRAELPLRRLWAVTSQD